MSKTASKAQIKNLAYVSHQVNDLDQARDFYQGILGLKSNGSYGDTWEEYDVGGASFAVWKASKITPEYFKKLKVTGALAFEVEDIDSFSETLKAKGVHFLQAPLTHGDHCKTAYLSDPDGNIITLHQLL